MIAVLAAASPAAAKRIALVIGNSSYVHAPSLRNPRNDAAALIGKLRGMGFEVIDGLDLDKVTFGEKLKEFGERSASAEVALFYYAGHGIQVDGQNYLVPVEAQVRSEFEVGIELYSLNTVLRQMERGSRTNIVFLDACRDNPFKDQMASSTRSAVSLGKGLGEVRAARSTYIAFATEPDKVAMDGTGQNSPFTDALLKHIDTPGASIQDMMIRVRRDVSDATNGLQTPWDSSSLMDSFSFVPAAVVAPVANVPNVPLTKRAPQRDTVREDFDLAMSIGSCGALNAFVQTHPDAGMLTTLARERAAELCAPPAPEKGQPQELALAIRTVRPAGTCADGPDGVNYCASSMLAPIQGNSYGPAMLFDGRGDTAWVEGRDDDGVGETITLDFGRERRLAGFEISNGYDKDQRVWSNNSRVRAFQITLSGGGSLNGELPDQRGMKRFEFGSPVATRSLTFAIRDVYRGARFRDTAISELRPIFAD